MKMYEILVESVADKIMSDPRTLKMLGIAFRHDHTIPRAVLAKLGPRPTDKEIAFAWSNLLDGALSDTKFGDLSGGKFDLWLTRLFIEGVQDYEDIHGEGGDALGAWHALSIRKKLLPKDQDFNKFKNLAQLQSILRDSDYQVELQRIADAEAMEKHKRTAQFITLIDDARFRVTIPLSYGACYLFNNSEGVAGEFCTGSSSGLNWFNRYAPDGIIVDILDKQNMNHKDGKWQFHAETNQLKNAEQDSRWDRDPHVDDDQYFANLFPGLMAKIVAALRIHAKEINEKSRELARPSGGEPGYDIAEEIREIRDTFPVSYKSKPKVGVKIVPKNNPNATI